MKNQKVYIVGKLTKHSEKAWKIQGVFTKEKDAVKACATQNHFVGEMELNKNYKANQKWKGAYFPKLESKPKNFKSIKPKAKKKLIGRYYYNIYYSVDGGLIFMYRVSADSYKEAKKWLFKVVGKNAVISHYVKG